MAFKLMAVVSKQCNGQDITLTLNRGQSFVHIAVIILLVLAVLIGPGLWVKTVLNRYARPQDRYQQTGREVARQLLDANGLSRVRVEETNAGDHYDPIEKVVRLLPQHLDNGSLAAVTIAAHEVGHAVQDARNYPPLKWRTWLVRWLGPMEKIGAGILMSTPLVLALTRHPLAGLLTFAGGLLALGSGVVIHLVTLPTEFDASFNRAMPMLESESVLYRGDAPHTRKLLRAAAMTYVSASLMSLLNIARWWAILRR